MSGDEEGIHPNIKSMRHILPGLGEKRGIYSQHRADSRTNASQRVGDPLPNSRGGRRLAEGKGGGIS